MSRPRLVLSSLLLLLVSSARAAPPSAADLTALIDRHITAAWKSQDIAPAPLADDAEFLRRVSLDLIGRIPSVPETRAFLEDSAPNKRERLVERLLASPRYVTHFTNVWRALLIPETASSFQIRFTVGSFEGWLREQLVKNVGYDQLVRNLLTAPVAAATNPRVATRSIAGEASPVAFYQAKEYKPENVTASISRLFLGVRLECAQCHNHPFADWKREQFWGFTAFFNGFQARNQGNIALLNAEKTDVRSITIPGTERVVQASFLDGKQPEWNKDDNPRDVLARWMTGPENRYFARAAVNRFWSYFLGTGLIDPIDEMVGADNVASHPELLDELSRAFVASGYDMKTLARAITLSQAYQRSSAHASAATPPQTFARMPIRGLSPEQLFDSVAMATGYAERASNQPAFVLNNASPRQDFLGRFGDASAKTTETQMSILQALALLNGKLVADATSLERSETLAAIVDAPFWSTPQRLDVLFLSTLNRKPTAEERERLLKFIGEAGKAGSKEWQSALADVFWVLLNSSEFHFNH